MLHRVAAKVQASSYALDEYKGLQETRDCRFGLKLMYYMVSWSTWFDSLTPARSCPKSTLVKVGRQ